MVMTMNERTGLAAINRSEMARALGVDLAHISRILSGQRNPSLKLAVRMAEYLGVSLDGLYLLLPRDTK